jgi:transposase-like protein
LEGHAAEAFPGKDKRTAKQQHIHEPESENRRLRLERAILKKAMAFFAKESARGIDSSMSRRRPGRQASCVAFYAYPEGAMTIGQSVV